MYYETIVTADLLPKTNFTFDYFFD